MVHAGQWTRIFLWFKSHLEKSYKRFCKKTSVLQRNSKWISTLNHYIGWVFTSSWPCHANFPSETFCYNCLANQVLLFPPTLYLLHGKLTLCLNGVNRDRDNSITEKNELIYLGLFKTFHLFFFWTFFFKTVV